MNRDASDLHEMAEAVASRDDFVRFLQELIANLRNHPEEWENTTLDQYLDAVYGAAMDIDGYYKNFGINLDANVPSWRVFAEILLTARVYE
jgi:hypothetical protein